MGVEFAQSLERTFQNRVFRVPDYQRGYAWDEDQWQALIDDIELMEPGKDHYTGTLVLYPRGEGGLDRAGRTQEAFDVVDGQQRLTTAVLLLHAIGRQLEATDPDLAAGITSTYVHERRRSGDTLYRLLLGEDSKEFWTNVALADEPAAFPPSILSHDRLVRARKYFENYLRLATAGVGHVEARALLEDLFDRVAHRLKVIPYEVDDAADVGVIFEVMNDRGKPLNELEKVKNYLLYLATKLEESSSLAEHINASWSSVLRDLMRVNLGHRSDEDRLLRAHWLMAYHPVPRDWKGARSIKSRFALKDFRAHRPKLRAAVGQYVKSLREAAAAYCDILVPSRPDAFSTASVAPRERRALVDDSERVLRVGAMATFLPLLVAARVKHPQDVQGYRRLLAACERYTFRVYRLQESRADRGSSQIASLAHDLYGGSRSLDDAARRVDAVGISYCSNDSFTRQLEADRNWYAWAGIRYFLYEYEAELAKGKSIEIGWDVLARRDLERSIEHILPQTPTDPYWSSRFDESETSRWTHDVGNLVLTEDNSSYGKKSFSDKRGAADLRDGKGSLKRCYANSLLLSERELASYPEWTPAAVQERREKLLEWAGERWRVSGDVRAVEIPIEDQPETDLLTSDSSE